MKNIFLAVSLLSVLAPAASARTLENIPLVWKPTTEVVSGGVLPTSASIEVKPFTDRRTEPSFIAENREGKLPKRVTTKDSVPPWCSQHLAGVLQQSGYNVVDHGGRVIITGQVLRFFVVETGNYAGEVVLKLTARSRGGATLWSGTVTGTTGRFGRSYKADNYYETLSDSVIDVVKYLRQDKGFTKAVLSRH